MRRFTIVSGIAVMLMSLLVSCGGQGESKDYMSLAVGSSSIDWKADKAKFGLLGLVKTVEYDSGWALYFAPNGKYDDNDEPRTRFKGRVRTDEGYSGYAEYTFDELGRLVLQSADGYVAAYTYEGNNYFPSAMKETIEDEYEGDTQIVEHIYSYSAKDFDEFGNWLSRKDNGEVQKRTITYYEDPYFIKDQPHYKSPKEVIDALLKAEKNMDAKGVLATMPYKMRKYVHRTLTEQEELLQHAKEQGRGVRSYKIGAVEIKSDEEAEISVTIVRTGGETEDWVYTASKGDDGYWYDGGLAAQVGRK